MFSSIDIDERKKVIDSCYWQFKKYVDNDIKFSLEMPAVTLQIINEIDKKFIKWLKNSINDNKIEFIGSGYSQVIGPLVPEEVNNYNQKIGQKYYKKILGINPETALVNEMAFSNGLISSYANNGYKTILTEWNNPASNLDLQKKLKYFPQKIKDSYGNSVNLIWCDSISFQQFQRYIHGDTTINEYIEYVNKIRSKSNNGFLSIYSGDAEIFDFRPGRYKHEASIKSNEWNRIIELHKILLEKKENPIFIKDIIKNYKDDKYSNNFVNLCSTESPIPVKKQSKYNITRWALTGRDDFLINSICYQLFEKINLKKNIKEFEKLIYFWSSDFRTHITEKRWKIYLKELKIFKTKILKKNSSIEKNNSKSKNIKISFNKNKGTIDSLYFSSIAKDPLIGTIKHSFYDHINLAADFYSGHTIIERPGKPKITSLNSNDYREKSDIILFQYKDEEKNQISTSYLINKEKLIIDKNIVISKKYSHIMKLYNFTFIPDSWDEKTLYYKVCNGGNYEKFHFNLTPVNQQKISSYLISSNNILGNTSGTLEIGDKYKSIFFETDHNKCVPLPYIDYQPIQDSFFLRLSYSSQEIDETFIEKKSNFDSSITVYGKKNIH